MLQKFEGLVMKSRNYGESNQIIIVFTEFLGKLAFVAQGSKKTKSRFGAVTEPFTKAHFVCFLRNGLGTLSQADLIESNHFIRSDLLLTTYAGYWLDLLDKLTEEKVPYSPIYRLYLLALLKLKKGNDPDILTRIIELQLIKVAGYQPMLRCCLLCQKNDAVYFSARQGGCLCHNCQGKDPQSFLLTEATRRILPILQQVDLDYLGEINVKSATKKQLEQVVHTFIEEHIDCKLKSFALLKQIRQIWRD